ncbi:MAG: hypothetical protein BMS9Abin37_1173 [Acidobacteriota bacterium]|nr:MAG: hypothetical protein BMS9Abin37_1173 [Acidobacteriota bacterium]
MSQFASDFRLMGKEARVRRERWERIKEIFDQVLGRDQAEQEAFLVEACGGDADLLTELRSLLAAFAEGFLEPPPLERFEPNPSKKVNSLVGVQVGNYRITEKIAGGGMGEIYKAVHVGTGEVVAAKRLGERALEHDKATRRFLREVRAAKELDHPHIVRVRGLADWSGEPILLMDFIEGRTLREELKARRFTVGEALDFAVQAASALSAAHAIGIVHRDVKPDNVMVADGAIKLLDFGLVKIVEGQDIHRALTLSKSTLSEDGLVLGSASYMSPEQVKGDPLDGRSDVFSLGVLVYEMLVGVRAFDGESPLSIVTSILFDEPEALNARLPGAPKELEEFITRAIRKKRSERFQKMAEMNEALEDLRTRFKDGTLSLEKPLTGHRSWLGSLFDRYRR